MDWVPSSSVVQLLFWHLAHPIDGTRKQLPARLGVAAVHALDFLVRSPLADGTLAPSRLWIALVDVPESADSLHRSFPIGNDGLELAKRLLQMAGSVATQYGTM